MICKNVPPFVPLRGGNKYKKKRATFINIVVVDIDQKVVNGYQVQKKKVMTRSTD